MRQRQNQKQENRDGYPVSCAKRFHIPHRNLVLQKPHLAVLKILAAQVCTPATAQLDERLDRSTPDIRPAGGVKPAIS
jgi:hypothetical protein